MSDELELLKKRFLELYNKADRAKFVKAQAVFMRISVKQITDKARVIWFQNLKLLSKNVVKQKVG